MRVHWISGWGVPPESLRVVAMRVAPAATHSFFAPTGGCLDDLPPADALVGWSLGAWRILEKAASGAALPARVLLLAPFVAFGAEFGLGGRCPVTQVRFLHRWVKRDPLGALKDFHFRADLGPAPASLPYAAEDLLEGLDRLAEDAPAYLKQFAGRGLPNGWSALVGGRDPLLDAQAVCRSLPRTVIVPDARHDVASLLANDRTFFHEV